MQICITYTPVNYEIFLRCLARVKTVLYAVIFFWQTWVLLRSSNWERRTTMMRWCAWNGWKVWHLCCAYVDFLITASVHIIASLTSREVVANVYLFRVLVCYMLMQVKYYLVIALGCGLSNCGSKQRSMHSIVLTKLANQRGNKRVFQTLKHVVICLTSLVVAS